MADYGEWGTLSLEPPDFVGDLQEGISSVTDLLINVLDVVRSALDVAKAFSVGSIDPINLVVDELLAQIKILLDDLSDLGLYISGDQHLLTYPFEDLKGGFQAYERRMIARLTDRTDPTRPDVASSVKVFAAFFYQNAETSEIARLVDVLESLARFFKQDISFNLKTPSLPTPSLKGVHYGLEVGGIPTWKTLEQVVSLSPTPPTTFRVTWETKARSNSLHTPPHGFLVTVSTRPDGIPLVFDRPKGNAVKGSEQPREYGSVRSTDGRPLVLHGGADHINLPSSMQFDSAVNPDGTRKDGKVRIFGMGDTAASSPIPLELLKDDGTYYLQRSFWVGSGATLAQWALDSYSIELDKSELPHKAQFVKASDGTYSVKDLGLADTYYVRVASVSEEVIESRELVLDFEGAEARKDAVGNLFVVGLKNDISIGSDVGEFSEPIEVTFPTDHTADYMQALESALAVLVLSRVDLPVPEEQEHLSDEQKALLRESKVFIPNVASSATGLEVFRDLIPKLLDNPEQAYNKGGQSPVSFRRELGTRIRQLASELYRASGPSASVEKLLAESTTALRTTTWGELLSAHSDPYVQQMATFVQDNDMTILESLDSSDGELGLALNPWSMGVREELVDRFAVCPGVLLGRRPGFLEKVEAADFGDGSGENAGQVKIQKAVGDSGLSPGTPLTYLSGSADRSPVFYVGRDLLNESIFVPGARTTPKSVRQRGAAAYCRSLFSNREQVLVEAAQILGYASAAGSRSPQDGEWASVRFMDVMPDLGKVLGILENWLGGVGFAGLTIGDAIQQYIDFLDARILDTQQMILKIEALIQSLVPFPLPKTSGLLLFSNGTDGVLSDFVSAKNKPYDSSFAYGAGMVLVAPAVPAFLVDLFQQDEDTPVVSSTVTPSVTSDSDPDDVAPEVL